MLNLGSILTLERPKLRNRKPEQNAQTEEPCLSAAELAECTCPDFCERDHDTD